MIYYQPIKWRENENDRQLAEKAMVVCDCCYVGHPGWGKALIAQVSEGGMPFTFSSSIADSIPTVRMDSVDVDSLLAEDELETKQRMPVPFRFGYPFEVSLGLDSAGTWTELANGDRVWRLRIAAPGAYSINLLYDEFWLRLRFHVDHPDNLLGEYQ